jgi:acetylornithine deacetylase/succinyl-diaminopimelate desuccinylase-like protein
MGVIFAGEGIAFMDAVELNEDLMSDDIARQFDAVNGHERVRTGLAFLESDAARTLEEQKAMTVIPAPPFKEEARAAYFRERLASAGLRDVHIDTEGNVIGVRRGSGGPTLVLSAHIDTVFPEGTDLTITEKDGLFYAPGIRDDSRGLAAVLSVARAFAETGLRTVGDVWFVGTVGEEGLGNLRGVRALFRDNATIDGFITIDGGDIGRVVTGATGSRRYRVTYKGPGGHSFGAFGVPSAVHAMGRAIAKIAEMRTPSDPKTTFNVGRVRGGTGATAIAEDAVLDLDLRSNSGEELERLTACALALIEEAAQEENTRWSSERLTLATEDLGARPAGAQPTDLPIVRAAVASLNSLGVSEIHFGASSTDCNIPISLGIPAVGIAGGGKSGGNHSLTEWYDPRLGHLGPQNAFLTALTLVGIDGLTQPALPLRSEVRISHT